MHGASDFFAMILFVGGQSDNFWPAFFAAEITMINPRTNKVIERPICKHSK